MAEITKTISQFIETQFPALYREEGEILVSFVKAYYEFLEENQHVINRDMFEIKGIDETFDQFLIEFRKKYLEGFPFVSATDTRYLIKNIMDLYRSKGSDESVKLLMKFLFNEEVEVYYPSRDVLRASDSLWVTPRYIEVLSSERSLSFVNKQVFGSVTGATAFVDAIVTKRSNNRLIDILYLSDVQGVFKFGEIITDDGILDGAPRVIGSLTSVEVTSTSSDPGGNSIGDLLDVVSSFGRNGKVSVSQITNATDQLNFQLVDGGYGYTLTDDTKILITNLMVVADNSNTIFETGETVQQRIEKIEIDPSEGLELFNAVSIGDSITGNVSVNSGSVSALIVDKGTQTVGNIVNPFISIQLDVGDTFMKKGSITLTDEALYSVGDVLQQESTYQVSVSPGPSFIVGEKVYQREFLEGTSNNISSTYNFGTVSDFSNNVVTITQAFGEFSANLDLIGETSEEVGTVTEVVVAELGPTGTVVEKTSNTEYELVVTDTFSANSMVIDTKTKVLATIESADDISVTSVQSGLLTISDYAVSNTYFSGTVLQQDDSTIKIATTSNQFFFIDGKSVLSDLQGTELTVNQIDPGFGASFKIGSLTNKETIIIEDEKVGDENYQGVPYYNIRINGEGSGVGYVDSITVSDGGTGYSNTSAVSIVGGGYLDQNTMITAKAQIVTDGSGSITQVNLTEQGEGYFSTPEITVEDGVGANLQVNMVFGYGFPSEPFADTNTVISDALSSVELEIGTIASLSENRTGNFYQKIPAISVETPIIASYNKRDQLLLIDSVTGTFEIGDIVTGANTSAKGVITSANTSSITVKDISFDQDFIIGEEIEGSESGATATVLSVQYVDRPVMGRNANITDVSNSKNGIVAAVKVVDSGFGYQQGETVTLQRGSTIIEGVLTVSDQGIAPGYWKSRTSHLNSEKRLHDNRYYQDFSYDIRSSINIEDYRNIVLNILHVAGTEFFGSLIKTTASDPLISTESTIQQF